MAGSEVIVPWGVRTIPVMGSTSTTSTSAWARLHRLARTRAGVTILDDARLVGIPDRTYQHRAHAEAWTHLGAGARLLPGAPVTESARHHAALLVLGPAALLSHRTALGLHDLTSWMDPDGYVHALVPYGITIAPPAMTRRHRSRRLGPEDATTVDGLRATTVARTLLDVAPQFGRWRLEAMLLQARQRHRLTAQAVAAQLARRPTVRGAGRFREAIEVLSGADVDSVLEARALDVIRRHGLPEPVTQHRIRHRDQVVVVDFAWPDRRVVLECDGRAFHGDEAFQRDRDRWNLIQRSGHELAWATWTDVHHRPAALVTRLRHALDR